MVTSTTASKTQPDSARAPQTRRTGLDDDDRLMQRVANGDRAAGHILIRRHANYVQRVLARKLREQAEIDDATQDVFISLWRAAPTWRSGEARLTTWLYRVASNKAIDILRRRRHHDPLDTADDMPDDANGAEQMLAEQDEARLVAAALETLTEPQRQAIELVYFKEMPQADAAQLLGVSLPALESSLRRARAALRKTLAEIRPHMISLNA